MRVQRNPPKRSATRKSYSRASNCLAIVTCTTCGNYKTHLHSGMSSRRLSQPSVHLYCKTEATKCSRTLTKRALQVITVVHFLLTSQVRYREMAIRPQHHLMSVNNRSQFLLTFKLFSHDTKQQQEFSLRAMRNYIFISHFL